MRARLGAVAIMAIADARLGQLALRLLETGYKAPAVIGIEAGRDAGGQHGGQQSAALLVCDDQRFAHVDLRVDVHDEPIGELRRVFDAYRPAIAYYNLRQIDARVPPLQEWLEKHARSAGSTR